MKVRVVEVIRLCVHCSREIPAGRSEDAVVAGAACGRTIREIREDLRAIRRLLVDTVAEDAARVAAVLTGAALIASME